MARHFFFLQGNSSGFFRRLGEGLAAAGHRVSKVNLCGGDWLFWGDWRAVDYTGTRSDFADFVAEYLDREAVSDIVLHNDCRQVHAAAIAVARARPVAVWVFEEGYLRPHWLTLERDGINGYSRLPDDPDWYRNTAKAIGEVPPATPVGAAGRGRVVEDFRWQWANYRYFLRYPRDRTHRPYPIWAEYATWATRLATWYPRHWQAEALVRRAISEAWAYYLFPLQLNSDSQVQVHSPFTGMAEAIESVLKNFAEHAPADRHLILKNHPLDNAWINYRHIVGQAARRLSVSDRVHFIDGGDLNLLLDHVLKNALLVR